MMNPKPNLPVPIASQPDRIIPALLLVLLCAAGCQPYQLQGRVVGGDKPQIIVVEADDPRLESMGIEEAMVELTLEPSSMSPRRIAELYTDERGNFATPVGEFGAGLLQYDLGVLCRAQGYRSLWQTVSMPPKNTHLLIVLAPGPDTYRPESDLLRETLDMSRQLLR